MIKENEESKDDSKNLLEVITGILFGFLAGTVMMILLAPKSGKDTRVDIQNKSIKLRDQSADMMEDAMAQVRSNVNKFAQDSREMINDFRPNGQEMVLEQSDRKSEAVKASKKAVQRA